MELISVVITTHDRDKELKRAIESVLNQTYKHIELIIIDDNTTKTTLEVVNQYKQDLVYVKSNQSGLTFSRNLGLNLAKGRYLVFLDDDDELLRDSIFKRFSLFNNLEDSIKAKTAFIYSGCSLELVNENRVTYNMPSIEGDTSLAIQNGKIATIPSTFFLNKEVFFKYNIKFDETFTSFVDHDFFMSIASKKLHIYFVNEPLTKTYIYPNKKSMVNDVDKRIINIKKFFEKWSPVLIENQKSDGYIIFKTNYVAKEYSSLISNSILSLDFLSLKKLVKDLTSFTGQTNNLMFKVFKLSTLKIIRYLTPVFLIKLFR